MEQRPSLDIPERVLHSAFGLLFASKPCQLLIVTDCQITAATPLVISHGVDRFISLEQRINTLLFTTFRHRPRRRRADDRRLVAVGAGSARPALRRRPASGPGAGHRCRVAAPGWQPSHALAVRLVSAAGPRPASAPTEATDDAALSATGCRRWRCRPAMPQPPSAASLGARGAGLLVPLRGRGGGAGLDGGAGELEGDS